MITPARNEAAFIAGTITSVIAQTCRPCRWVIVSDGSTDGTDEVVRSYASIHRWIHLVRMPERRERHFAGKVHAFNAGLNMLTGMSYDIVGNLDADISFGPTYFEYLLGQFSLDPRLGVAGTPFSENGVQYNYTFSRREHVSGACQLFRRECFAEIGGYLPLKEGAVDLTAVVTARMKGWRTATFTGMYCVHHRPMGTAGRRFLSAAIKSGYGDYRMGVHPLWQILRSFYQMTRKPLLIGGCALLGGYLMALVRRAPKPVSEEFVRFRRREQVAWLGQYLRKLLPVGTRRSP